MVNYKDFGFTTVSDKLFELDNIDKLSNLEKTFFGLVKGDTPEEKFNIFRSYSLEKMDTLCKHLVDSRHGLDYHAKVVLDSSKTIVERDFGFSFTSLFPRIVSELLHKL